MFTKGLTKVAITLNKTLRLTAGGLASRQGGSRAKHYKDVLGGYVKAQKQVIKGATTSDILRGSRVVTSKHVNDTTGGSLRDYMAAANVAVKKKPIAK